MVEAEALEERLKRDLIRMANELKRDRRDDLKRHLEQRRTAMEAMKAEVEALEGQIDPAKVRPRSVQESG